MRVGSNSNRVLSTIEFNDEALFKADEIDHVLPDRRLPAELATKQTAMTELLPKATFGICLSTSQRPGK